METIEKKLSEERNILLSNKSREYTEYVLKVIGEELEKQYPKIDFMLKARYKSQKSFDGKVEKQMEEEKSSEIYDNIGFAIIVRNIPTDAEIEHKYCMKLLQQRANIQNEVTNKIIQANKLKRKLDSTQSEHAQELDNIEDSNNLKQKLAKSYAETEEAIQSDLMHVGESLQTLNISYNDKDNECNRILASHMLKYIIRSSKVLKKMGIKRIPDRSKEHTGGESGYYIASHNAIKSNKPIKGWKVEIQALSYQNYQESKEGDAKHSDRKGKKRVLPMIPGETESEKRAFFDQIKMVLPQNIVYQTKKGVYKCNDLENFCYYYIEQLKKNKDYFNEILTSNLLSDKIEAQER